MWGGGGREDRGSSAARVMPQESGHCGFSRGALAVHRHTLGQNPGAQGLAVEASIGHATQERRFPPPLLGSQGPGESGWARSWALSPLPPKGNLSAQPLGRRSPEASGAGRGPALLPQELPPGHPPADWGDLKRGHGHTPRTQHTPQTASAGSQRGWGRKASPLLAPSQDQT